MAFGYQVLGFGSAPVVAAAAAGDRGDRGVFVGGQDPDSNIMEYISITSTGDVTDFGDLTVARGEPGACSNGSRGLCGGGGGDTNGSNVIDYWTFASLGDASDFGDIVQGRNGVAACSDGTKGVFWHGSDGAVSPYFFNIIEYVNITSLGNSTDFGDAVDEPQKSGSAVSDGTKGIHGGGRRSRAGGTNGSEIIDYINMASIGNSTNFGDLYFGCYALRGVTDGTKAVWGGGNQSGTYTNILQFINIASLGDSTDFGDLTSGSAWISACSNGTRGVWGHGYNPAGGPKKRTIDYITIASLGNASDFGDRSHDNYGMAATAGD